MLHVVCRDDEAKNYYFARFEKTIKNNWQYIDNLLGLYEKTKINDAKIKPSRFFVCHTRDRKTYTTHDHGGNDNCALRLPPTTSEKW